MDYKFLFNAQDELEANMLMRKLEEAALDCKYMPAEPVKEVAKLLKGYNSKGFDVFAAECDFDKAYEITREFAKERLAELERDNYIPWYKNSRLLAGIVIVWGLIILCLSMALW